MHVHQIYFRFEDGGQTTSRVAARDEDVLRATMMDQMPRDRTDVVYTLWTLEAATRLIREEYPIFEKVLELRRSRFPIVLCDFFRYLLMYHFGGIYLDLDFVPVRPLGAIFEDAEAGRVCHTPANGTPSVLLCEEWENSFHMTETLHNGALHSRAPGHPFWWDLVWRVYREVVVRGRAIESAEDVYVVSGPKLLRECAREAHATYRDVVYLPYYAACPYVAVTPHGRVVCNGTEAVPSIRESSWVFFNVEDAPQLPARCPRSYYVNVCLSQGSMWKRP